MSEAWMVHVVDDDAPVREGLSYLLQAVGFRVATYADAEAFLRYEPAAHDLLICDVRMPGMSGIELTDLLKRRGSTMPILVITGHASRELRMQAMSAGADGFLEKPISLEALLAEIARATAVTA